MWSYESERGSFRSSENCGTLRQVYITFERAIKPTEENLSSQNRMSAPNSFRVHFFGGDTNLFARALRRAASVGANRRVQFRRNSAFLSDIMQKFIPARRFIV